MKEDTDEDDFHPLTLSLPLVRMTSQSKLWTMSKHGHPDFGGSVDNLFGKHIKDTLVKRINNEITAAILFTNQNYKLQYLFHPHVFCDVDGNPSKIVGNASNSSDQLTLMEIDIDQNLLYFVCIFQSDREPAGMAAPTKLTKAMCVDTVWKDRADSSMVACLASKIVPIPFGVDPPQGPIDSNEVATDFGEMGSGYEGYIDMIRAHQASQAADIRKIVTLIQAMEDGAQTFIHAECTQAGRKVDITNGPFVVATIVDPARYPNIADSIRKFYGTASSPASGAPHQYIIKSADDTDKETAKKDGLNKLKILLAGGKIQADGKITNVQYAIFSKSMLSVTEGPRGVMQTRLLNFLTTALNKGEKVDALHALSQTTMPVIQTSFVNLLLNCQFSQTPLLSIGNVESNTLSIDAWAPQLEEVRNKSVEDLEIKYAAERNMGLGETQRTIVNTTVKRLGIIKSMDHLENTHVNFINMVEAMTDEPAMEKNGGKSILSQLMERQILRYRVKNAKVWLSNTLHQMPQLPFNGLSHSDCMMNACARTALDFGNGNKINSGLPSANLDITGFREAASLDAMIADNMMRLIAMRAPVTEVSRLTPSEFRFASQQNYPRGGGGANGAGANGGGNGTSQGNRGGRDKRDTPNGNGAPPPDAKRNRGDPPTTGTGGDSKEKGFVILKDTSANVGTIFPAGLEPRTKPCPYFCCQGLECTFGRNDCPHGNHFFGPKKIPGSELDKVANHFQANGHAWFNKRTIESSKDYWWPKSRCTKVLGNRRGVIESA